MTDTGEGTNGIDITRRNFARLAAATGGALSLPGAASAGALGVDYRKTTEPTPAAHAHLATGEVGDVLDIPGTTDRTTCSARARIRSRAGATTGRPRRSSARHDNVRIAS